ncbi:hypothetical protein GYMLUDRAFT_709234 [Collybiopsis luxurians FD-317 M1]|nr:hypothetical protein GYMLUDRAFT_709234 [Collybiopsis luxurians FD-317 M1]
MPAVASSGKAPSRRKEKNLSPEELKDIDQKRLKGELSCAECRRLKLRCDKKVPCSSCVRRGCESICPCGILEAGIGTRFILASTTQLHAKISLMSSRIRALEDALAIFQATVSSDRHPLLEDELLKIKFGSEAIHTEDDSQGGSSVASGTISTDRAVDTPTLDAFGTLTLGEEGEMKYFGRSAGSETLILAGQRYVDSSDEEGGGLALSKQDATDSSSVSETPLSFPSIQSFSEEDKDGVPPEIYALALDTGQDQESFSHFPSPLTVVDLLSHLPPRNRADALAHSYISHASLFFRAMKKDELFESILPLIYSSVDSPLLLNTQSPKERGAESDGAVPVMISTNIDSHAPKSQMNSSTATPAGSANPTLPSPHLLSTLFFIFALGSFFDLSSSVKKYVSESEMLFELGRKALVCSRGVVNSAAPRQHPNNTPSPGGTDEVDDHDLALSPASKELLADRTSTTFAAPPSSAEDTVRALGLMATYCSMSGKKYARDSAWCGMSLAAKVAQGSGMHRDPARWHMDPKTVQRRRELWWEVCTADISHSVALGRPPSIHLSFVDCEFPTDEEASLNDNGEEIMGLWRIRYMFAKESFTPVISTTLTAKSPTYSAIMDLDKKIRELSLPAGFKPYVSLHEDGPEIYHNSHLALRDFYVSQFRTVTMLYLHRSFFAHAMLTHPSNPLMSPFAPSFLAAYRAASVIIKAAIHFYDRCPAVVPRVWFLTYHVFSAAVTVGTVVKRSPNSSIARSALNDLGQAVDLFEKCASSSTRNRIACALLQKLKERADRAYKEYLASSKSTSPALNKTATSTNNLFSAFSSIAPSSLPLPNSPDSPGSISKTESHRQLLLEGLDLSLFSKPPSGTPDDEDELAIWGGQTRLELLNRSGSGSRSKGKGKESFRSHIRGLSFGSLSPGTGTPAPSASSRAPTSSISAPSPTASSSDQIKRDIHKKDVDTGIPQPLPSDTSWDDAIDAQMNFDANLDLPMPSMATSNNSIDSFFTDPLQMLTQPRFASSSSTDVAMADVTSTDFGFDLGGFGFGGGTAGSQGFLMDMALEDIGPVDTGLSASSSSSHGPAANSNPSASRPSASETQSVLMEYLSGTAEAPIPGIASSFGSFGGGTLPWGTSPGNPNNSFGFGAGGLDFRGGGGVASGSSFVSDPSVTELHARFLKYLASKRSQQQASNLSNMLSRSSVGHPMSTFAAGDPSWMRGSGNAPRQSTASSASAAADSGEGIHIVPTEEDYSMFFESLVRPGGGGTSRNSNNHSESSTDPLGHGTAPPWNTDSAMGMGTNASDASWAAFMRHLSRTN